MKRGMFTVVLSLGFLAALAASGHGQGEPKKVGAILPHGLDDAFKNPDGGNAANGLLNNALFQKALAASEKARQKQLMFFRQNPNAVGPSPEQAARVEFLATLNGSAGIGQAQPKQESSAGDKPPETKRKEGAPKEDKPKSEKRKEPATGDKPKEGNQKGTPAKEDKPRNAQRKEAAPGDKPKDGKQKESSPKEDKPREARSNEVKPRNEQPQGAKPQNPKRKESPEKK